MANKVNKAISVTLITKEEAFEKEKLVPISNSIEINSEDNGGKSTFYDSDTVYLRFHTTNNESWSVHTSKGSARKWGLKKRFEHEEWLTFSKSDKASLSYLPVGNIRYSWVGKSGGSVQVRGNEVHLNSPGTGILKITYNAEYSIIKHYLGRVWNKTKVLVYVEQRDTIASIVLDYNPKKSDPYQDHLDGGTGSGSDDSGTDEGSQQAQEDANIQQGETYFVTVKDYSTGTKLGGVEVYCDGIYKGLTNENGRLSLGTLYSGQHRLDLRKSGYFDSSSDTLNNDYFFI